MIEILGQISLVYLVVMMVIFIGATTWHRDWDSVIGLSITALIALTWPVSLPMLLKEYWSDRKQRKEE